MYQLTDSFTLHDDNLIPHTLRPEIHSAVQNLHASVDERGFVMGSIGNRWIVNTPALQLFSLCLTFSYTYLERFDPCTYIFFGYDARNRKGDGIRLKYSLSGEMLVSLVKVDRMKITEAGEDIKFENFKIDENERIDLSLSVEANAVKGSIGGRKFSFAIDAVFGNIALERKNFIGEWIIREISVSSEDELEAEALLPEQRVYIPLRDGGDIPYEFTYKAEKIGSQCYLTVQLGGGTATREINPADRPGQYMAELDRLVSPFVTLRNGSSKKEYNLYHGTRVICDPNICWDCLKRFFSHPDLPLCTVFPIDESDITDATTVSFGYEEMSCIGYLAQSGGPSEFVFDKKGNLLYQGEKLGESVFELLSPDDKYAVSLIPKDTYRREDVIRHLEGNHYFHVDEQITLTMSMKTTLPLEHFTVTAEIRDVYDSECLVALTPRTEMTDWQFGYRQLAVRVQSAPLPLGVYRIVFTVCYGDTVYKSYNKVFEVFDKDAHSSPAMAVGLPFTFSMPNEQKWLASNTFDLWNPKPSCDEIHYISCVTTTPIEAEKQKIWELIPIFGREWYAWLNRRVCLDCSIESHPDIVRHADYLYANLNCKLVPRVTTYLLDPYQKPIIRDILNEFLEKNPSLAERVTYKPSKAEEAPFTYEELKSLLDTCHTEWFDFFNARLLKLVREQNEELKKINPKVKRAFYGPFFQYGMGTASYHIARAFGYNVDEALAKDIFTGFALFEDYPSPCAYPTYRGAFAAMTFLLHCPELVIYPEQYSGSDGGCIDGAVKFAYAPMGKYDTPVYFNTTHAFEYVFNTPHRSKDGYKYWTSYGFHRRDHEPEMADRLARDWKHVIFSKPAKPCRTMAIVTEYFDEEDVFSYENLTLHGFTTFSNVSDEGHAYIYDCARESGLNAPFALKLETISSITADECDVLVIPTLKYVSEDTVKEIRRLYESGVSLVAVSDVCGLEDIFGVRENNRNERITELCTEGDSELIFPNDAPFKYDTDGAEIVIASENGSPVLLRNGRALLINAPVSKLGYECFEGREGTVKNNVSELLRRTLKEELIRLSSPLALGEGVGITLFESEKGRMQLLAIDYSPYDNRQIAEREVVVKINLPVREIRSERRFVSVYNEDGSIKEIRFTILPHESVMFYLCE